MGETNHSRLRYEPVPADYSRIWLIKMAAQEDVSLQLFGNVFLSAGGFLIWWLISVWWAKQIGSNWLKSQVAVNRLHINTSLSKNDRFGKVTNWTEWLFHNLTVALCVAQARLRLRPVALYSFTSFQHFLFLVILTSACGHCRMPPSQNWNSHHLEFALPVSFLL